MKKRLNYPSKISMYWFARAAITEYHTLGDQTTEVYRLSSGGWKPKTKLPASLVSSEGCEEGICPGRLSLAVNGYLFPVSLPVAFSLCMYLYPNFHLL